MAYLGLTIRCLLIALFLASVVGKSKNPESFAAFKAALLQQRFVSSRWVGTVAATVVISEATLALALVWHHTAGPALFASALTLTIFAGGLTLTVRRGVSVACNCFGTASSHNVTGRHVWRNIALAILALGGAMIGTGAANVELTGVLLAVGVGGCSAVLIIMMDEIMDTLKPTPRQLPTHMQDRVA